MCFGLVVVWLVQMMSAFNRSKSFNQRTRGVETPRSFSSPKFSRLISVSSVSRWFHMLVAIGSLLSFFVAIVGGYIYVLPSLTQAFQGFRTPILNDSMEDCNVSDGGWVVDDSYPLYNASECPFAEQGFNCLGNGRKDKDYLKWRWQPNNCNIPRFNVSEVLERLRNKRIVFVGDSMSRTQWESLICLLMTGIEDKHSVYEVNGNKITKQIRFLGVRFSSFNLTVDFFRSVFLVQYGWLPRHVPKRVRSTLKLDKIDDISSRWVNSDFLLFNTGQWWVPGKLFDIGALTSRMSLEVRKSVYLVNYNHSFILSGRGLMAMGCYFQVNNSVKLGMSIPVAFRVALDTWASWVQTKIDRNRTRVFFRTYEPSHWSNQPRRYCNITQLPLSETKGKDKSLYSDIILVVVKNMTVPITVLHISSMSALRSDAHVGMWSDNPVAPDCSHWCLPGVPDMWNEIFLSYLLY